MSNHYSKSHNNFNLEMLLDCQDRVLDKLVSLIWKDPDREIVILTLGAGKSFKYFGGSMFKLLITSIHIK